MLTTNPTNAAVNMKTPLMSLAPAVRLTDVVELQKAVKLAKPDLVTFEVAWTALIGTAFPVQGGRMCYDFSVIGVSAEASDRLEIFLQTAAKDTWTDDAKKLFGATTSATANPTAPATATAAGPNLSYWERFMAWGKKH